MIILPPAITGPENSRPTRGVPASCLLGLLLPASYLFLSASYVLLSVSYLMFYVSHLLLSVLNVLLSLCCLLLSATCSLFRVFNVLYFNVAFCLFYSSHIFPLRVVHGVLFPGFTYSQAFLYFACSSGVFVLPFLVVCSHLPLCTYVFSTFCLPLLASLQPKYPWILCAIPVLYLLLSSFYYFFALSSSCLLRLAFDLVFLLCFSSYIFSSESMGVRRFAWL